jgi:hypothetical protein
MTLPVSGAISFNAINVELGVAGTTTANINQASYRTLAGVPGSGTTISLSNFYGKSNRVALSVTYSSSTANASLNLSGISGYVAGGSNITITINAGVYLYATTNANAGLTLTGGTAGDTLTIVNNGYIMGGGGNGSAGGTAQSGSSALSIPISATINNTNASAYIGGGGGGGQGGTNGYLTCGGGGGAGGGNGGAGAGAAGTGGAIGSSGSRGPQYPGSTNSGGGGGGGRIFPSTQTTFSYFSASPNGSWAQSGPGGSGGGCGGVSVSGGGNGQYSTGVSNGGGPGQAGSSDASRNSASYGGTGAGGGGGWGASGSGWTNITGAGAKTSGTQFGVGGRAVQLNGNSVTWTSGNTTRVYGAVS